jgi:hypothetical protein
MGRLLFEDNCVAREIDYAVTTYEAVQARVEAMCSSEPGCMYLSLEDYAASMEFEDDPTRNCAANIIDVLRQHTSWSLLCHVSFERWSLCAGRRVPKSGSWRGL